MSKLGINQIMLLKRANEKGSISVADVKYVYNYSNNPRDKYNGAGHQNKKATIICEKLELYGLFERFKGLGSTGDFIDRWKLTRKGKKILKENLKKIKI